MLVAPRDPETTSEPSAGEEARLFLLAELADGAVRTTTVRKHARDAGIAKPTLDREKKRMGFRAVRADSVWYWPQISEREDGSIEVHHPPTSEKGDALEAVDTLDRVRLTPGTQETQQHQEPHVSGRKVGEGFFT
jgi:hypothetical protein